MSKLRNNWGTVYLVGAGPGDPGLLTIRAKELLEQADIVFFDHLVNPKILRHCRGARLRDVGKRSDAGHPSQARIERLLVQASRRYAKVLRLKGGDPFIFGRGGEEAEALHRAGVDFEIVPGVSSATAVPAYAGIPLTHRDFGSSVTFVTGHEDPRKKRAADLGPALDWPSLARQDTLVFLMGVKTLEENFRRLILHGKNPKTPAALIEWGTYPRQRSVVGTLESLPTLARRAGIQAPAIAVVGEVVGLRKALQWFEARPLFGKKILVTRSEGQASDLGRRLEAWGAEVLELPAIKILPPKSWKRFDAACRMASSYDWLLFTSVNGVEAFLQRMAARRRSLGMFRHAKIAAVGPRTAERLREAGLIVTLEPKKFNAEGLAVAFSRREISGQKLLLLRAEQGREELLGLLRRKGARLDLAEVYRSAIPKFSAKELEAFFANGLPDLLTFASGATAENLKKILRGTCFLSALKKLPSVVIGPITKRAAKRAGWKVIGQPSQATLGAMADFIRKILTRR